MQRGRMRAEAQSNAEQRRQWPCAPPLPCARLALPIPVEGMRRLERGVRGHKAQRAPVSPAHPSFPSTSSQMLLHTHTVLHLSGNGLPCPCVPAQPLFKSTPEDKLFTRSPPKSGDRHIIRTCTRSVIPFETCSDDGNNHYCSGDYPLLQPRNPLAWQIIM
jgi:hypothetical protein